MSSHACQVMATSRKRKERDGSDAPPAAKAEPVESGAPSAGNRLLAGYLAHEFLTQGTLFGQRWDPADTKKPDPARAGEPGPVKAYAEVACLLKAEGAHVPGVVNPTQLARWLQM
ncbi:uncharacterized protein [Elaeis guineensis]|uniref:Uncharacterized protein LOC105059196 n=1 Tax=Elaeis guineensis var. tenera TaxID=51953 RepID=A0A6I9SB25_ELAGV|nr:uncharacterized protein LOC105059196 [Elaeis guineensis]